MPLAILQLPCENLSLGVLLLLAALGLVALCFGGDWLTRGAAGISVKLRINPVVVGLTIVAASTSMPELITSLIAARESPGIAMGNIIGSNVANVGLILGVGALVSPMLVQLRLVRREVPFLIFVTALFTVFAVGGLGRLEGFFLLLLGAVYMAYLVRWARAEPGEVKGEFSEEVASAGRPGRVLAAFVVGGSLALLIGADVLVETSIEIASRIGVSDSLIGLTLVAVGTSLPELAASVAAARAGHGDICIGNIVGSNLFNMLLVGGAVASLVPLAVEPALFRLEFPCMFALTVLLLWVLRTGNIVTRKEGALLLVLYTLILGAVTVADVTA